METIGFCLLSIIAGFPIGFVFGCSHSGFFIGLLKGLLIGGLFSLDLHLMGVTTIDVWCFFGASLVGFIVATFTPDHHSIKRYFDLRRPLDL